MLQLSIALSALITPPLRAPAPDMQAGTCAALRLTHDDVNQLSKAVKSTYLEAGIKRGLTGAVLPTAETEVLVMLHGSRARVKRFASWCAALLDGANVELEEDNDGCPAYQLTSRFPLITPDEGCGSKPSQVEVQLHATSDDEELGYLRRHLRLQVRFACFAFFDRAPTLINAPLSRNSRRPRFTARSATRWSCRAAHGGRTGNCHGRHRGQRRGRDRRGVGCEGSRECVRSSSGFSVPPCPRALEDSAPCSHAFPQPLDRPRNGLWTLDASINQRSTSVGLALSALVWREKPDRTSGNEGVPLQ